MRAPEVRHVSHTYAQNVIHVLFSTKDRRKLMPDESRPCMVTFGSPTKHVVRLRGEIRREPVKRIFPRRGGARSSRDAC